MDMDFDGIEYSSVYLELKRKYLTKDNKIDYRKDKIYVDTENGTFNVLKDIVDCKVKATSIKYDMSMYSPDHFTVELLLTANNGALSMSQVANELMGLNATMYYDSQEKKGSILSGELIVYLATPSCTALGATTNMTVVLDIYSSDKLLELKKFSQSFTGLPLTQIIEGNHKKFVPATDNQSKADYHLEYAKNKRILDYNTNHEVIQPYLVQYNETFRSMLNRTANRCGEFLYWHDGKLQLGLHDNKQDVINLDMCVDKLSLSMQPASIFDNVMTVAETHRSGNAKADADKAGTVNYDLETGMPDFNETVPFSCGDRGVNGYNTKRMLAETFGVKFSGGKVDMSKSDPMKYVIGKFLTNYAKTGYILDFLSDTVTEGLVTSLMDNLKKAGKEDAKKQKINNKRFMSKDQADHFGFEPIEQTNFPELFDVSSKKLKSIAGKKSEEYDNMESNNKIAPFSTLRSCITSPKHDLFDGQVLGNEFYSNIRSKGKQTSQQAIDITLRANAPTLGLGDRIKVNGKVYVITAIKGDYTDLLGITLHAIPSVYKYGNTDFYIPEPLPEQNRVMDGNCTAIVTDNADPYGQGRVRVRFSWQGKPDAKDAKALKSKKLEDSTPWIRMTSPLASQKSNIFLQPQVNDEVIVGFENGNPERPYVLGSLFNGSAKAPSATYAINGINGESITMEDENMSVSDLVGKLISPVTKTILDMTMNKDAKGVKQDMPVGGKISLKDKYGFYSLSMSSKDRKIDIKCPLGDVSISAFTGITLSAPNGDINIKGKNVSITAGDKLTLTSGTNKDIRMLSSADVTGIFTKMITKIATSAMKTFVGDHKVVDLSTMRSMWEVLFRPINGTMLVSSKRHLLLQAGKGNAEIPIDAISVNKAHHAIDANPNYPYYLMKEYIKTYVTTRVDAFNKVKELYGKLYTEVHNTRENENFDNENGDIIVEFLKIPVGIDLGKMSEKKMLQILQECVEESNDGYIINKNNLNKLCPYPDSHRFAFSKEKWLNKVTVIAQLAADFANALVNFNKIKENSEDFTNTEAGKSFIKAMDNAFIEKREWSQFKIGNKSTVSAADFTKNITFTPSIKLGNDEKLNDFTLDKFVEGNAVLANFENFKFSLAAATDKVYYEFIKILEHVNLVYYIPEGQEIKVSKKSYKIGDLPRWNESLSFVQGYPNFKDFLARILPATKVDPAGTGVIEKAGKDMVASLFNDALDSKNLNWMCHHERNLWDATAHPGYILMSDEKGVKTVTLTNDGELKASSNNTVDSLLTAMGKPKNSVNADKADLENEVLQLGKLKYNRQTIKEHLG